MMYKTRLLLITLLLLSACGQKGALIRPAPPAKAPIPVTSPTSDQAQP
jgi:predicted small lipoprotein YifL